MTEIFPTLHLARDKDGELAVFEKYTPIRVKSSDEEPEEDMWGLEDENYFGINPVYDMCYPELTWADEPVLLKEEDWKPVSELPENDGVYLVLTKHYDTICVHSHTFKNGKWGPIESTYNHFIMNDDMTYMKDSDVTTYISWYSKTTIK